MRTLPSIAHLVEPQQFQLCSLRAFFTTLGAGDTAATAGGLVLSALACWWMIVAWTRGTSEAGFAALLITTILISPHETVYDLVLLAPALLLLAQAFFDAPGASPVWPLLIATYLLALTGGIVRVTHVQLASPVMLGLLYLTARTGWTRAVAAAPLRGQPRASAYGGGPVRRA
jgi:hypothetical protein